MFSETVRGHYGFMYPNNASIQSPGLFKSSLQTQYNDKLSAIFYGNVNDNYITIMKQERKSKNDWKHNLGLRIGKPL